MGVLKLVGGLAAVAVAYALQVILRRHWYFIQLKREDFSHKPNFVEREIETVYYEPGKLGEVLTTVWSLNRCL